MYIVVRCGSDYYLSHILKVLQKLFSASCSARIHVIVVTLYYLHRLSICTDFASIVDTFLSWYHKNMVTG